MHTLCQCRVKYEQTMLDLKKAASRCAALPSTLPAAFVTALHTRNASTLLPGTSRITPFPEFPTPFLQQAGRAAGQAAAVLAGQGADDGV
jgi:hypothetical protein